MTASYEERFRLRRETEKQTASKWDKAAGSFDLMNAGIELRYGEQKREWFSRASGKILLVAIGTGLDLPYFPPGADVIGVDISEKMLGKAAQKIKLSGEGTKLLRADVQEFGFKENSIDTVVTSCTFCSVPDPVKGLKELLRVLKPGGKMLMFEHVRSSISWMGPMMDILTFFSRRVGPELNRNTRGNIVKAGFHLTREVNVYLDMVKLFEAEKP